MMFRLNGHPAVFHKRYLTILKHVLVSWFIFSTLYWIAASHKPFHVDEFYSWVYAERCTFMEILLLKEFGIGHPPLYHLIQKAVQNILPSYHPIHVRLANYLIGSLFIIIFVNMFVKYKNTPFFCYGVCASATILDVFVFSRMWGVACLSSLLLLWSGEKYYQTTKRRDLAYFLGACALGIISDYNFIVLIPYVAIILFSRKSWLRALLYLSLIFLVIAWLTSTYLLVNIEKGENIPVLFYRLFSDFMLINLGMANILFNFWFVETFLIVLLVFSVLISLEILKQSSFFNSTSPFAFLSTILSFLKKKAMHIFDMNHEKNRILVAIIGALLILLSISPLFWRNLINKRFLFILCPFIFLFTYLTFNKKALYSISIILAVSGLIYVSSNRISDYYPPPAFDEEMPVIFQDEFAYSTQYFLRGMKCLDIPLFIDLSYFEKFCRICKMGTTEIPFDNFESVCIVGRNSRKRSYSVPPGFVPSNFTLSYKKELNLTWLDRLQFRYLTPIFDRRFVMYKYLRNKKINQRNCSRSRDLLIP